MKQTHLIVIALLAAASPAMAEQANPAPSKEAGPAKTSPTLSNKKFIGKWIADFDKKKIFILNEDGTASGSPGGSAEKLSFVPTSESMAKLILTKGKKTVEVAKLELLPNGKLMLHAFDGKGTFSKSTDKS